MNELVLVALCIGSKRPAPGVVVLVWATLHLGVLSPTRRSASPGSLRSAGQDAPADGHNPRTPWPSVQPTQGGGDDPSTQGGGSESSDEVWAVGSSPKGDEDLCGFSTPRIPKWDDPKVDPPSPVVPINAQKVLPSPQRKMVPYSLPVRSHRQLTKRDQGSFDFKLLNSIEAVAKSAL
jgi:hypothetical protein